MQEATPIRKLLRLAALAYAFGLGAHPAFAGTATADAEATVVRPLSLVKTEDLVFGSMIPGATAGTVTIAPATGVQTRTGGVTLGAADYHRAEFLGMAQVGILTTVSLPAASTTLTRVGGGASMTATLGVEGGTGIRWFPGTGIQTFRVGGTLSVAAHQPVGQYVGTFTLQVDYL